MVIDDEVEALLIKKATKAKTAILREYIAYASDIEGIDKADQAEAKLLVLILVCDNILEASKQLIDSGKIVVGKGKEEEEGEKEWN